MTTINDGDLVNYDAFLCGIIPAKLLGCTPGGSVVIRLTADRKAHKRGEVLHVRPNDVSPRKALRVSNGKYYIAGTWRFASLAERDQPRWA